MSEEKKNRQSGMERAKALELAMDNLPVGVGLFYPDGQPCYINSELNRMYGLPEDLPDLQLNFTDLIELGSFKDWGQDPVEHFRKVRKAIDDGHSYSGQLHVGGRIIAVHDMPIEGGYLLTTQQDVTEQVTAEQRVAHLANHDALTDLPNRAAFNGKIADAIEAAKAKRQRFSLMFLDIDHFKDVNDIFGHKAGDMLLLELSGRFRQCVQGSFLARLGGDEFTVIVEHGPQPEAAGALANHLVEAVNEAFLFDGNRLSVGLSVGIAVFPDDGEDAKTLMGNADVALYRAKAEGRGLVRLFEPVMDERIHRQRQLKAEMRDALQRGEFALAYQPQANVSGNVYAFEVLMRWNNPARGNVPPEDFIPVAEESGKIMELGEWALRTACAEAAGWENPLQISVNLSPVQFRQGDLAQTVHEILLETGLAPGRLELEITEGVLIQDFSRALAQLRRLKALGVRIAMDDFGTGYSSLSYLQAFPFDVLKIDKSFIASLKYNDQSAAIIRAMIGLGHGLNLSVIAEGVETPSQLQFLSEEKCENVQGFLIGTPRPIGDYAALIKPDAPPLDNKARKSG